MTPGYRPTLNMVQALTILTALQMFSDGGLPTTEASGEPPYGVDRGAVANAAVAGLSFNPPSVAGRDIDGRPVPALSQVTPTSAPGSPLNGGSAPSGDGSGDGGSHMMEDFPLAMQRLPCDGGNGELRYEKLPDVRLASRNYDSDVIRKNAMPSAVMGLCLDRCLKDRTGTQLLPKECSSVDIVFGSMFSSYSDSIEYTETKCFLSKPDDNGVFNSNSISQYERAENYAHFREKCFPNINRDSWPLSADCPERLYVVERFLGKMFIPKNAFEVTNVNDRDSCVNTCVNQLLEDPQNSTTICRSGTWDRRRGRCYLSSYTRRTHPAVYGDDPDMEYFENTCLSAERRCPKNRLFYLKEVNTEMSGPFDTVTFVNVTLDQCKEKCVESKSIFCRSMEYNVRTRVCVIADEDSTSKRGSLRVSASNDNVYFELQCIDGDRIKGEYLFENDRPRTAPNTEPLNARSFRDVYTAFQLYRNRNLQLQSGFRDSSREANGLTLAECLDRCLEERSFACRSVSYSQRYQSCKLSEYDQYNGELQYDGEFDYFENLMGAGNSEDRRKTPDAPVRGAGGFDHFDNRNNIDDDRRSGGGSSLTGFGSSSSGRFDAGSRRTNSRNDFRNTNNNRSPPFEERPGLFRPISTDFSGRDQFTSNNFDRDRDSFRDRGQPSSSSSSSSLSNNGRGSSGSTSAFDTFIDTFSFSNGDRGRNRIPSTGRFSGGALDSTVESNRFGSGSLDSFSRPSSGFGLGGSSGSFSSGGDEVATSNLGKIPGQVAQQCHDDGSMEFTLRTESAFNGRIYVHGYYDRCFEIGRGSAVTTLRISPPRGFQDCGTIKFGDTITNIVVVQFAQNVQTMLDKRYNLTCTTIGPTDSIVKSNLIGAGYGSTGGGGFGDDGSASVGGPTQIEYLELENRLDQKVALRVLYDGRPTTTIAVGDPLTFKLEPQVGFNLVSDIFATNVVARDPYSGRTVQLIDSRGCPVDNYIFPALGRARSGDGLETRFSAFKIPESNFLVFEANVRPCKDRCPPAMCRDTLGREEVESFGRKKRDVSKFVSGDMNETIYSKMTPEEMEELEKEKEESENEPMEHVHGIYEVYLSRDEIPSTTSSALLLQEVCLSPASYHGLLVGLVTSTLCLFMVLLATWFAYRYYMRGILSKNLRADSCNPSSQFSHQPLHDSSSGRVAFPGSHPRTVPQPARYFPDPKPEELALPGSSDGKSPFRDPSEPIYTDPTLFEKAVPSGSGIKCPA